MQKRSSMVDQAGPMYRLDSNVASPKAPKMGSSQAISVAPIVTEGQLYKEGSPYEELPESLTGEIRARNMV